MYLEDWLFGAVVASVVAVLVWLGWLIYDDVHAEKFALRKDSWACTKSHNERHFLVVGKIVVPQTRSVCTQWTAL